MNMEEIVTSIADCIYARRCDEHKKVVGDCPYADYVGEMKRPIPPYCSQWCELLMEPTAKLKDDFDWRNMLKGVSR